MSSAQSNMPTPDEPKNTMSSKPMKDEDFTAIPSFNGKSQLPHPSSTVNHDPFGLPDTTTRTTPSHYTAMSESILGYANKARDMVLGSSNKPHATSSEDQAREMIGTGIPSYSLNKHSSLNIPTATSSIMDRNMTHSPTLYESIATDNPAVAFGEPEDDMAAYEVHKYRATHPYPHRVSNPIDTHLMEVIADYNINNGGFDEAEDAMAMYEASKYRALHEQRHDKDVNKNVDKTNEKMKDQSMKVDPTWINVE